MQVNPEDGPPKIYVTWSDPRMTDFKKECPTKKTGVSAQMPDKNQTYINCGFNLKNVRPDKILFGLIKSGILSDQCPTKLLSILTTLNCNHHHVRIQYEQIWQIQCTQTAMFNDVTLVFAREMIHTYSDVNTNSGRPKVDVTVSACHFRTNMTVTWPSAYIVFTLSRSVSVKRHFS